MWISMEDMVKQKKNATFGGRLKMAREDASLTQEELAALLRVWSDDKTLLIDWSLDWRPV